MGLNHGTEIWTNYALYSRRTGGCFADASYGNLGGVAFFHVVANTDPIAYEMELFLNPHALAPVTLPEDVRGAFHAKSEVKQSALTIRAVKP